MKILVASNDRSCRKSLGGILSRFGNCDLSVDGLNTVDAFLVALKENRPYQLICLDTSMPETDVIKAIKAIRDLESRYSVPPQNHAWIILVGDNTQSRSVQLAFDYGCQDYITKPVNATKITIAVKKLELKYIADQFREECDTAIGGTIDSGNFKSVQAMSDYRLKVVMETGTAIHFDFHSRLNTIRFGALKDMEMFRSVSTDGFHLIFSRIGRIPVRISSSEFMDLALVDSIK